MKITPEDTHCEYHSVTYRGKYCFICDPVLYKEELECSEKHTDWYRWLLVVKKAYPKNVNGR